MQRARRHRRSGSPAGEPLLRRGLAGIVARLAALRPRPEISLTTNAIGLARLAGPLRAAGLDRVNVSLDTLSPGDVHATLARRDRLRRRAGRAGRGGRGRADPGQGQRRADARGQRSTRRRSCCGSAWTRGYQLRFIEQMPLDAQHGWRRADMVTADGDPGRAERRSSSLTPDDPADRGSAPAEAFLVDGGPARVGVIASVTRPFCGTCDRVRLTADGQVRNCLFARDESDLRGLLRAGAPATTSWPRSWRARGARSSCPATASTTPASCSRPGRCRPSAADQPAWMGSWYTRRTLEPSRLMSAP